MQPPENARSTARLAAWLLCALGLVSASAPAGAANTAESEIRVQKGEGVRISKIDDWVPAVTPSGGTITGLGYRWDYQCVYTSTGAFQVTVESANVSGAGGAGTGNFFATSAAGDTMTYGVGAWYRRGTVRPAVVPLYQSSPFTIANLSGSTDPDCTDEAFGGSNLFFAAYVTQGNFNAAPSGIYRDTVTIVVSPE